MTSSLFDPQLFLESEVTGEVSTRANPIPLGRYEFVIEGTPKFKEIIPGPGDDYEAFVVMEVDCVCSGDALDGSGRKVSETTGKDKNFARYKCNIDRTPSGNLDMAKGKNVGLGRLRAALRQDDPVKPWKPALMNGGRFSGEVKHRVDKNDNTKVYAEIVNPLPL